jgi:hypothetical protein
LFIIQFVFFCFFSLGGRSVCPEGYGPGLFVGVLGAA